MISLAGLADTWDGNQEIRARARETGSIFRGTSENVPPVTVREAIHNQHCVLPALVMLGKAWRRTSKTKNLFTISAGEGQLIKLQGCLHGSRARIDRKTIKRDAWLLKKFCVMVKRKMARGQKPRDPILQQMFDALRPEPNEAAHDVAGNGGDDDDDDDDDDNDEGIECGDDFESFWEKVKADVENGIVAIGDACVEGPDQDAKAEAEHVISDEEEEEEEKAEEKEVADSREDVANSKEDVANSMEDVADSKEDVADSKDADSKEDVADSKEDAFEDTLIVCDDDEETAEAQGSDETIKSSGGTKDGDNSLTKAKNRVNQKAMDTLLKIDGSKFCKCGNYFANCVCARIEKLQGSVALLKRQLAARKAAQAARAAGSRDDGSGRTSGPASKSAYIETSFPLDTDETQPVSSEEMDKAAQDFASELVDFVSEDMPEPSVVTRRQQLQNKARDAGEDECEDGLEDDDGEPTKVLKRPAGKTASKPAKGPTPKAPKEPKAPKAKAKPKPAKPSNASAVCESQPKKRKAHGEEYDWGNWSAGWDTRGDWSNDWSWEDWAAEDWTPNPRPKANKAKAAASKKSMQDEDKDGLDRMTVFYGETNDAKIKKQARGKGAQPEDKVPKKTQKARPPANVHNKNNDDDADDSTPRSFAKRKKPPTPGFPLARWHALRDAFINYVKPSIPRAPSQHEDSFWAHSMQYLASSAEDVTEENLERLAKKAAKKYVRTLSEAS